MGSEKHYDVCRESKGHTLTVQADIYHKLLTSIDF
jgi:hypothetical protein